VDEPDAERGTPEDAAGADVEPWTNVQVAVASHAVVYLWEWVDEKQRRLRVLRSRSGFAAHADEAWQGGGAQIAVYEGEGTSLRDAGLAPLTEYWYTFFVREGAAAWRELLRERLSTVAEDAQPRARPLLHDGPSPVDEVLVGALTLADVAFNLYSLLHP